MGLNIPDPAGEKKIGKYCKVPCGKTTKHDDQFVKDNSTLHYNEYIVFDQDPIRIKFIVHCEESVSIPMPLTTIPKLAANPLKRRQALSAKTIMTAAKLKANSPIVNSTVAIPGPTRSTPAMSTALTISTQIASAHVNTSSTKAVKNFPINKPSSGLNNTNLVMPRVGQVVKPKGTPTLPSTLSTNTSSAYGFSYTQVSYHKNTLLFQVFIRFIQTIQMYSIFYLQILLNNLFTPSLILIKFLLTITLCFTSVN